MDQTDDDGVFIRIQLPGVNTDLDLGTVSLDLKYPKQIQISSDKLSDLQSMREQLYVGGRWIQELAESQQKLEGLCQQVEDDCESHFDEETWGENNSLVREKVQQVAPQNALIPLNNHKMFL